jgi:hypothetical protein
MKETPRRRISVTSSFNEMSTVQLGNRMADTLPASQQAFGQIFEDYVNVLSFT